MVAAGGGGGGVVGGGVSVGGPGVLPVPFEPAVAGAGLAGTAAGGGEGVGAGAGVGVGVGGGVGLGAGFGFGVGFGLGAGFGSGAGVGLEAGVELGALAGGWVAGTEAAASVGPLVGFRPIARPAPVALPGTALPDPTRGLRRPEDEGPPTARPGDGTETCRSGGGALAVGRPSSMVVTNGIRSGVRAETQSRVAPASDATAMSTTIG